MNSIARNIIMNRRRRGEREDGYSYRVSRYPDFSDDYARGGSMRGDRRDYESDYRQGVKGTGRYGMGGSRYYGDRARNGRDGHFDNEEDFARDYRDYRDYADYGDYRDYRRDYADDEMKLTKSEMREWKRSLENADGSLGEHFDKEKILSTADKIGVKYKGYDENDLCLAANILYSDYGEALKMFIPTDKEAIAYTKMAKAFLEDPDSIKGSEKLAVYYNCIVKDDEE